MAKLGKSQREKDQTQVVSIIAFNSDGKFLMGLRRDSGKWNLPGGHVEPGEALAVAARRELKEEVGLEAEVQRVGFCEVRDGLRVHTFVAKVSGEPSSKDDPDEEMASFKWIDPAKLPKTIMGNLHNSKDVSLQFLGLQDKTLDLVWDEDDAGDRDGRQDLEKLVKAQLSPEEFQNLLTSRRSVKQRLHERIQQLVGTTKASTWAHKDGGFSVVGRDPHNPQQWRSTRILPTGEPNGHDVAPDHAGALMLAHEQGADLHGQPHQVLAKFEADAMEWLIKATRPQDFKSITRAVTPEGPRMVDHKTQMQAHPADHAPIVEHYENEILRGGKIFRPKKGKRDEGITRKVIFQTQHQPQGDLFLNPGREPQEHQFMVKPYHEGIVKRISGWQKYPIQGWAEMANQALYHAGGIGHLHQKVHVSEHDMGPGHEKEPALVVHMEKGMTPAFKLENHMVRADDQPTHDTMKIGMMDFLTNNLDRHGGNLLFKTEQVPGNDASASFDGASGSWIRQPVPMVNSVMAIDHSRSFQYVNNHHHKWDTAAKLKKVHNLEDSFGPYIFGSATGRPATSLMLHRPKTHEDKMEFLEHYAKPAFDWWEKSGPKIRASFDQQLQQIKDPEVRAHISRNFNERAKWLDERANMGIENYGTDWYHDPVTQYHPHQKSDEEIDAEKTAAARAQWEQEQHGKVG